jgi:hypothetical protein
MARDHGRILCRIWDDPEFRALSVDAQRLYILLLSQPTLNYAGITGLTFKRWARCCNSSTVGEIEKAIAELADSRFVALDDDTEELLVRSFIRNDGIATQPNMLKMALREAQQTASLQLRRVLAAELRRLPLKPPDTEKMKYPDPHAVAELLDPEPFPGPPKNPSENPSAKTSTESSETHAGRSRGRAGVGEGGNSRTEVGSVSSAAKNRGQRIEPSFAPTDAMLAWAKQRVPPVPVHAETEKFINYWAAKPGREGLKLDWPATWRNWMLNAFERLPAHLKSTTLRPVEAIPDDEINPDAVLGPDSWSPPTPPLEVDEGPVDRRRDWFRQQAEARRLERIEQARAVLARRQSRGTG